ncbi:MAG: hypothetical protein AAF926_03890 [Pseudomonadota bacterium]
MKLNRLLCAAGALSLAATGCAYQGGSYGHSSWSAPTYSSYGAYSAPRYYGAGNVGGTRVEFEASYEDFIDGEIIDGDVVGGTTYNQVEYKDAYKPGYRLSAGLARDFSPSTTVTAKGFYKSAEAEDPFVIGNNGGNVMGGFTDYESYGAELGLRKYLGPQIPSRMRPYLGASVGAAYIDDIAITGVNAGPLNEGGWVPTASGTAGLELPMSPSASFALESGIRWTGSQDRTAVASAAGFTDDGSKMSVPVTLRGSFRF